jgi:DNA-binding MarR family transcriptional regulator
VHRHLAICLEKGLIEKQPEYSDPRQGIFMLTEKGDRKLPHIKHAATDVVGKYIPWKTLGQQIEFMLEIRRKTVDARFPPHLL